MTVNLLEVICIAHCTGRNVSEVIVASCWNHTRILEVTSPDNPLDDENIMLTEL